jgi:hypothetical protein
MRIFEVGKEDEKIIRSSFLNLNIGIQTSHLSIHLSWPYLHETLSSCYECRFYLEYSLSTSK